MTTGHARTHGPRTRTRSPSSWGGVSVAPGTLGWYGDASGGFFLKSLDEWNPRLAFLVFPRITSSSRIDRCDIGRLVSAVYGVAGYLCRPGQIVQSQSEAGWRSLTYVRKP